MSVDTISERQIGVPAPADIGCGVHLHQSGLLFAVKPNAKMWEQIGFRLFSIADSSSWWIADWLVYGESEFHGRYEEAIKRTSLSYQTLRNYTWVARTFPLRRRYTALSFSHHLEVVALEQPEQDYWLRKASEMNWSRNKLRAEVRGSLRARRREAHPDQNESDFDVESNDAATPSDSPIPSAEEADRALSEQLLRLHLSTDDLAEFGVAAEKASQTVESWALRVLRSAAAVT